MARRPKKILKSDTRVHVSFFLDADAAREVDSIAKEMSTDRYKRNVTRTDVLKILVRDALDARKAPG